MVSFQERLTLSPLEKFRKHGKIPFKLIFHVLLLSFSSAFIVARNVQFAFYYSNNILAYSNLFQLQPSSEFPYLTFLYTVDGLTSHLSSCVTGYLSFPNTSVTTTSIDPTVLLSVQTASGTETHRLTAANPLGPLATNPVAYVQAAYLMTVEYTFENEQLGNLITSGPFDTYRYR